MKLTAIPEARPKGWHGRAHLDGRRAGTNARKACPRRPEPGPLSRLRGRLAVLLVPIIAGCNGPPGDGRDFADFVSLPEARVVAPVADELLPRTLLPAEALPGWQRETRQRLKETFRLPSAAAPDAHILERREIRSASNIRRELVIFRAEDGTAIPAILQTPKGRAPTPAILVLPGHTRTGESGLWQLVYGRKTYQHGAATRLTEAGFTTLTFELRGFGLLAQPDGTDHVHVAYNALRDGSFYKRLVLSDAAIALALLRAEPGVDPAHIGVTGASLGGELAVTLGALDERLGAVAFSSYGGAAGPFPASEGSRKGQPHYCHIIPGSSSYLRQEDMVLLLAPRPVLGLRGEHNFTRDDGFAEAAVRTWSLTGSSRDFAFQRVAAGEHEFFVDETIDFFGRSFAQE